MRATQLAKNMVTKWGLSEKLGPLMYAEDENEGYLGRGGSSQNASMSADTAKLIDLEIRSIIDTCYGTAKQLLVENRDKLDRMAEALMKYETIDADQIDDIMAGRVPREPRDWQDGTGGASGPTVTRSEGDRPETPIGGPAGEH
jgi:cell division protease FtsH